ncbi:MAG: glycine--tRNA ligase [Planctomycetes bacterium]|nr:glycine--tRNA ligase [Planctomycetota bacterium]
MNDSQAAPEDEVDLMKEIISLCKQRGFIFQSSEIYGGLKSCYDYGPLGAELKRNIMNEWWRAMVHEREDVVGLDASIIMHTDVWKASGHLAGFADPLVDCLVSKERFRADNAPRPEPGDELTLTCADKGQAKAYQKAIQERFGVELKRGGKTLQGLKVIDEETFGFFQDDSGDAVESFPYRGYVSPEIGSPFLSDERQFNLMFRTSLGPVDPVQQLAKAIEGKTLSQDEARELIEQKIGENAVYLRPETAQAMFVQFANIQQALSLKVPFGIAQMGKSFRNEITVEHFIFRSCEFEQMEMEYFVEPGTQKEALDFWKDKRLRWYQRYANDPSKFRLRQHEPDELAHYADDCYDIEYEYPWGWGELEGIASRTDYDLKKHSESSGVRLTYFDQEKENPETGKKGVRYTPYVVEPAAGATRTTLMYLLDAFCYDSPRPDAKGNVKTRRVLKLHPRLAPYKVAVLPLVKRDGMPELAREIVQQFFNSGINAKYDEQHQVGKRYARHDEVGTPYCLTVDGQSLEDGTVTIRDRDTMEQERIAMDQALEVVMNRLVNS